MTDARYQGLRRVARGAALCLFALAAGPAWAVPIVLVGTGNGALRHNGTTKIDIVDPDNNNAINTAEWGLAPIVAGSASPVGTFNAVNNGENWAKVFDNAVNVGSTWGTGTSKVCCNFTPGVTSVSLSSATASYHLTGYTLATGNDSPTRRPTGWRLFGSNDAFATPGTLLDTVVAANINGGSGWTSDNQVGEATFGAPTAGYSSFRFVFDNSVSPNNFQLAEIELLGFATLIEVGGNNAIGSLTPTTATENAVGGARYIRVLERAGTDSRFHISEIEAFAPGVTPNNAGPASANSNPNLSTNDISAAGYNAATTTATLEHGNPVTVYDGDHETGAGVWSTAIGLSAPNPRYTLDMGATVLIGTVRVYPRNEVCCEDRFANLRVELYADGGGGTIGALIDAVNGPDNAPGGTNAMLQVAVNAGLVSADFVGTLLPTTYVFEINAITGQPDRITVPNPDPLIYTTILDLDNADFVVEFLNGIPAPGVYDLLDADQVRFGVNALTLPDPGPDLSWDATAFFTTGELTLNLIPEPATFTLLLLGALPLLRRRRRA